MEPEDQLLNDVAPPGSSLYYATRFLTPAKRRAVLALHATAETLRRIPRECSDPGVARIKLDWWRRALSAPGPPGHPALQALARLWPDRSRLVQAVTALADAVEAELEPAVFADFGALCDRGLRFDALLWSLSVEIAGHPAAAPAAADLGRSMALARGIQDLRGDLLRGRPLLAADDLERRGLSLDGLLAQGDSGALADLLAEQAARARALLDRGKAALPPGPGRRAALHALIAAAIQLAVVDEIAAEHYPVLARRIDITPLRRLWIAWRLHRRTPG